MDVLNHRAIAARDTKLLRQGGTEYICTGPRQPLTRTNRNMDQISTGDILLLYSVHQPAIHLSSLHIDIVTLYCTVGQPSAMLSAVASPKRRSGGLI